LRDGIARSLTRSLSQSEEQVAQKLHACTGPYSAGRARDVLDILLIDLLDKLGCEGSSSGG